MGYPGLPRDMRLTTNIHDRDAAGFVYVYPVVSRRARGVSVGVNLNPNNACNWRCIYCQVPGLVRGAAPELDLELLESELRAFLEALVHGDYMEQHVPEGSRRLNDVALSGNGESTTSKQFDEAVECIGRVLEDLGLAGRIKLVLITNGSRVERPEVLRGLDRMKALNGEVWFKIDSATAEGRKVINDATISTARVRANLELAANRCRTRIQTCVMALDGEPPSDAEQEAYLAFIESIVADRVPVSDVLLYGLERASHQPEAPRLSKLPPEWLEAFAKRIEARGLPVQVNP